MSSTTTPKVSRQDIRKIIFDNFNDTDYRFSNDEILGYLNEMDRYKTANLDVLDFEDVLLEMEESGFLRPIAQNFNTRYYKIMTELETKTCKDCNTVSWFAEAEEPKSCPRSETCATCTTRSIMAGYWQALQYLKSLKARPRRCWPWRPSHPPCP